MSLLYEKFFKDLIQLERRLDQDKQKLAEQSNFTLEGVHALFTDAASKRLTLYELMDGFYRMGLKETDSRLTSLIMARFDAD